MPIVILTPAKLLYKKLRPRSEPRARKRLQISLDSAEPICSHEEKSSIGAEERSLRDLCIEYAADYCDSVSFHLTFNASYTEYWIFNQLLRFVLEQVRSAIEEIDGLVKAFEGVWDLVCSGSLTAAGQLANAKRMKLQIIDISSLTQLRERYTAIGNSLWQKPGWVDSRSEYKLSMNFIIQSGVSNYDNFFPIHVRMSCRYHLDVADVHRALVATQCAIIETLRKLMIYLDGCRMPTQAYGVRCKLEVRENLTEANATCIKVIEESQRF